MKRLIFALLIICCLTTPLVCLADNGGQSWSSSGHDSNTSHIIMDSSYSPGDVITITFSDTFWSTVSNDVNIYIVPLYMFNVGSDYYDSVKSYCNSSSIYSRTISYNSSNFVIRDINLVFPSYGNYICYIDDFTDSRLWSYYFNYYPSYNLAGYVNFSDYDVYLRELNSSNSVVDSSHLVVPSTNNSLNINENIYWQQGVTSYGRLSVSLNDLVIPYNSPSPYYLFHFDDFSVSRLYNGIPRKASYIVYVALRDSVSGQSYGLGIIDNIHGGMVDNYSGYYFVLPYNIFNSVTPSVDQDRYTLEFSFRINVSSVGSSDTIQMNVNIKNLNFYYLDFNDSSIYGDIVGALNDPSFGSFDDPFDSGSMDDSSSSLGNAVGNYSSLEDNLLDNADVDISYHGNPLSSLGDSFYWWSQVLSVIYINVPSMGTIISICVTVGLFAVIVGIGGRAIYNRYKKGDGDK